MSAPTQIELARRLGLSRSTIAAALNPKSTVKLREETKRRILREAEKTRYRPHRYAQIMRKGRSGLIGIFHFGGLYQVAAERAWHASQAIQKSGYHVLSNDASWSPEGVAASCEAMLDAQVEGVIVAGLHEPAGTAELNVFQQAKIPLVSLSGNPIPGTPQVRADAEEAFFRVASHLVGLGRRRLLLLYSNLKEGAAESLNWAGTERLKGFQRAARKFRIPMVKRFIKSGGMQACVAQSESDAERFDPFASSHQILKALLVDSPPPDAVICGNDHWAIGALAALREAGLSTPQEVAVTGFDNISVGPYLEVPLTTLGQPTQAMAEKAVDLLLKQIKGGRVSAEPLKFPCELIVRASCGAELSR